MAYYTIPSNLLTLLSYCMFMLSIVFGIVCDIFEW